MRTVLAACLAFILLAAPGSALAGPATDQLKTSVDVLMKVIHDEGLKKTPQVRREKIWEVVEKRFAETYMTSRVVTAREWKKLKPDQQKKLTELFTELVKRSYVYKLEAMTGQKVFFDSEQVLTENRVEVGGYVLHRGEKIPLGYRLINEGGQWKIYDLLIDETSQVLHFKRRFRRIIQKDGYQALVDKLKNELAKSDLLNKKE